MNHLNIDPFQKRFQTLALLTAGLLIILSTIFYPLFANSDYTFRDENKNEVASPTGLAHSLLHPGAMTQTAPYHNPEISIKARREGLEDVRVLDFYFSQLPDSAGDDSLNAIYVLDKDGLVVGYKTLQAGQRNARIVINSVINYVQIYVKCTKHGFWKKELAIKL